MLTEEFMQDIVEGIYIPDHSRGGQYPDVRIIYDRNNDKEFDRSFASVLDKELLNYVEWYYSEDYVLSGKYMK